MGSKQEKNYKRFKRAMNIEVLFIIGLFILAFILQGIG